MTFTEKVLTIVHAIPKGETLTYKQVAIRAGKENAARAVGSIMRKNYRQDVPCHRVTRSDGIVGDYNRGGSTVKKILLKQEGVIL